MLISVMRLAQVIPAKRSIFCRSYTLADAPGNTAFLAGNMVILFVNHLYRSSGAYKMPLKTLFQTGS